MMFAQKKLVKRKTNIIVDANFVFKKIKKITITKTIRKSAAKMTELDEEIVIFVHKQLINKEFTILKQFALINYRSKEIINVHII